MTTHAHRIRAAQRRLSADLEAQTMAYGIDATALDNFITGHYGEDEYADDDYREEGSHAHRCPDCYRTHFCEGCPGKEWDRLSCGCMDEE